MDKQRLVSTLSLFACFFAVSVIALGAFTRLIDAGLGCPDWPGCYGHWVLPLTSKVESLLGMVNPATKYIAYKAWAEMIHRYFAGILGLLILCIVILIFSSSTLRRRSNLIFALGLIALLFYQILLGQQTVTLKLLPIIVTQHLLGGFLILCLLWVISLNNNPVLKNQLAVQQTHPLTGWVVMGIVLLFLQILLGAWTSTNYAALSCPDFPLCDNQNPHLTMYFKQAFNLFSPIGNNYQGGVLATPVRQTIQMTHRMGALIVTLYLITLSMISFFHLKNLTRLTQSIFIMLGLLVVQLSLGIINVVFKLPLMTAILHNVVAVLLLLSLITFLMKLILIQRKVSTP